MKRSRLIQRLNKPVQGQGINPYTFGGGLKNGGLSDNAMNLISGVFSFDYMGAAEFERGAIPKALDLIAQQAIEKNLIAGSVKKVFYICQRKDKQEVEVIINKLVENELELSLKEYCGVSRSLESTDARVVGWLELDNSFMFFVDEQMFMGTKKLFGIP